MKDSTRAVRSGLTVARAGEALHAGRCFVSTFHTPGEPEAGGYSYGRFAPADVDGAERAIGELEVDAGRAPAGVRVFGSGLGGGGGHRLGRCCGRENAVVVQEGIYLADVSCWRRCLWPTGVGAAGREWRVGIGREATGGAAGVG